MSESLWKSTTEGDDNDHVGLEIWQDVIGGTNYVEGRGRDMVPSRYGQGTIYSCLPGEQMRGGGKKLFTLKGPSGKGLNKRRCSSSKAIPS